VNDIPQTVFVWAEDEDRSGTETGLAALTDEQTTVSGDTIDIPPIYPGIAGIYAGTEFAEYPLIDARLAAPGIAGPGVNSLKIHTGYAQNDGDAGSATIQGQRKPGSMLNHFDNPLMLGPDNRGIAGMTLTGYSLETDEAGVAHMNSISLFVSNTALPYVPHRVTHVATFTMGAIAAGLTWESKSLTLDYDLPVGSYRVHEVDIVSATAIAARLVTPELNWRAAFVPRRSGGEEIHLLNKCIHPGGIPFTYRGGTLPLKVEYCAETTDTALSGTLWLEKVA
jgi:hypothetical protein